MILLSVTRSIYGTQNGYLKAPDDLKDAREADILHYANNHEDEVEWDKLPEDFDQFDEFGDIYCASIEEEE